jgi:hypothetical protein
LSSHISNRKGFNCMSHLENLDSIIRFSWYRRVLAPIRL